MIVYIIGIIVFSLILITSIVLLIYFTKDEKKLKEVSNEDLIRMNKIYSKKDMEDKIFEQYNNILLGIEYDNYAFLKDAISDNLYNELLYDMKQQQDKKQKKVVKNIRKEFCRLISIRYVDNLEVAKFWVRYSNIEYTTTHTKQISTDGKEELIEMVVEGSKEKPVTHEYILTFVKNQSQNENIVCPNCGYQMHMLTSSRCTRCDLEIIPKTMHWVYTDKIITNLSKLK